MTSLRLTTLAAALCLVAASAPALADPPAPKVCVVVGGDPDEAVRTLAEQVTVAIAQHRSLRGVADADARAALRGEAPASAGAAGSELADLVTARRSLRGTDADAEALRPVIDRLGCGLVLELRARPAGVGLRILDGRDGHLVRATTLESLDATAVVQTVASAATPAPATTGATATSTTVSSPSPSPSTAARRTSVSTPTPRRSTWSRVWPWLAVGGVAAGVLLTFLVAANPTAGDIRLQVTHRGQP